MPRDYLYFVFEYVHHGNVSICIFNNFTLPKNVKTDFRFDFNMGTPIFVSFIVNLYIYRYYMSTFYLSNGKSTTLNAKFYTGSQLELYRHNNRNPIRILIQKG